MIEERLKKLIEECMGINVDQLSEEEKTYPLLSSRLGGMPYQMLVLFVKVEDTFKIKIDNQKVADGKFNAYADILKLITEALQK